MAALTLSRIGSPVLWHDELATWSIVSRSTDELIATLHHLDAVHGTYYLMLHGWIDVFGDSPTSMRLPSALAMIGATMCTALAARRMFGQRAGLAAGLVFALVPSMARFGQEARSYAFVVFAAALATLFLLRALERGSWPRWMLYTLSVALLAAFHLVALVLLVGHAIGAAIEWRRSGSRRVPMGFCAAMASALLLAAPVFLMGNRQMVRQISWIPKPGLGSFITIWPQIFASATVAGAIALLAAAAWSSRSRGAAAFASAMALLPLPLLWVASHGDVSYFFSKYFFFTVPAWAILAGAGLAVVGLRAVVLGAVVIAVLAAPDQRAMHAPLSHGRYTYPGPLPSDFTPLDYRAAARIVAQGYRPGDAIAYDRGPSDFSWLVDKGVEYYLPSDVRPRDVFVDKTARQRDDLWATECMRPAECLGTPERVWVVTFRHSVDPVGQLTRDQAAALRADYHTLWIRQPAGMTVALLERGPSPR